MKEIWMTIIICASIIFLILGAMHIHNNARLECYKSVHPSDKYRC